MAKTVDQCLQDAVRNLTHFQQTDALKLIMVTNRKAYGNTTTPIANTRVYSDLDPWRIVVRYAGTDIVELQPLEDYPCQLWRVTVDSGGWETSTTKNRINVVMQQMFGATGRCPSARIYNGELLMRVPSDNEEVALKGTPYTFIQSSQPSED